MSVETVESVVRLAPRGSCTFADCGVGVFSMGDAAEDAKSVLRAALSVAQNGAKLSSALIDANISSLG